MKQGPRSSPRDQGGIQNYATGTISSNNVHQRISSPRANLKEVLWILTPKPLLKGHAKNGLGKNTHYGGTLCDWKTTLHLNIANGSLTSRSVSITRGIIQGGSLSPLLFCLALTPPPAQAHYSMRAATGMRSMAKRLPISFTQMIWKRMQEMTNIKLVYSRFLRSFVMVSKVSLG